MIDVVPAEPSVALPDPLVLFPGDMLEFDPNPGGGPRIAPDVPPPLPPKPGGGFDMAGWEERGEFSVERV